MSSSCFNVDVELRLSYITLQRTGSAGQSHGLIGWL